MESRSSIYTQNDSNTEEVFGSRTAKNAGLYREIREADLGNYNLRSNAKVIDNNSGNNIDIDHIKSILDTHYKDAPRIHTIPIEDDTPKQSERKTKSIFEITKEYDLNTILNKAKEGREENYQEDRVKKLHDTQFNILKDLNINPKDYIEEYDDEDIEIQDTGVSIETSEETSRTLRELIDTIALNEKEVKKEINKSKNEEIEEDVEDDSDTDPLDIFSDLKGSDNTVTLDGLQEKTQELMDELDIKLDKTRELKQIDTSEDAENNEEEVKEEKQSKTTSLDNEFFTTANSFKKSDFEDYEELDEDKGGLPKVFIVIMSFILSVVFLIGLIILIKSFI